MNTFLRSAQKRLKKLEVSVKLSDSDCSIPFLVDRDMKFTIKVKELSDAVINMWASGCKLVAIFSGVHGDSVLMNCHFGVYLWKYLSAMKVGGVLMKLWLKRWTAGS